MTSPWQVAVAADPCARGELLTNDGYWQTGRDLWERKSGIVTETIGDIAPFDRGSTHLAPAPGCSAMCRG
jgi:hypothetical protein